MKHKGKPVYEDFEGDAFKSPPKTWRYCTSCEQWIPPPYIHSCYDAREERRARKRHNSNQNFERIKNGKTEANSVERAPG
jgi:hypothetical protein